MSKTPFSHHIFIFPFRWDYLKTSKCLNDSSFLERTRLADIERLLPEHWEKEDFSIKTIEKDDFNTYNEYTYFHDYSREVLGISRREVKSTLRYRLAIRHESNPMYNIHIKGEHQPFKLNIDKITAYFYDVGVGCFAFHLENRETADATHILKINNFGRRIYPQFLGTDEDDQIGVTQGAFLPEKIELKNVLDVDISEEFTYFNLSKPIPDKLPAHISKLLGSEFEFRAYEKSENVVLLRPIIDDRMYTMSFYFKDEKLKELSNYNKQTEEYSYINNDFWYSYVYVDDTTPACSSKTMMRNLLKKSTYDRWLDYKWGQTLYGISRYSFVVLLDRTKHAEVHTKNHFKYHYFNMAVIALMQRAAILRFSGETSHVVDKIKDTSVSDSESMRLISELYLEHIYFINKMYHREISPQEQGIELYEMLTSVMEIEEHNNYLNREIQELHNYASFIDNKNNEVRESIRNKKMDNLNKETAKLTRVATWFLPAGLLVGILGMNTIPSEAEFNTNGLISIIVVVLFIIFSYILVYLSKNNK